jgi:micrococcal nuclease
MRLKLHNKTIFRIRPFYIFLLICSPLLLCGQNRGQPLPKGIRTSDKLPQIIKAEVIGIQDGDTVELKFIFSGNKAGRRSGKPLRIRLLHIDCPERGAPFYKVAKQFTAQKCFRQTVQVTHASQFDRYGRLLGEVVLPGGKILNKELVKNGYAVHFKKYSASVEYADLEIKAKKQKLGIWAMSPLSLGKL